MKKKNKLLLAILSIYTVVLFKFLLHGKNSILSILFFIFIALVNLTVYFMLIKSNEKEMKVHLIVGKSRRKELMDQGTIIGGTQLFSLILLELIISNVTGTANWSIVFWLLFFLLNLLGLEMLVLWLFLRRML